MRIHFTVFTTHMYKVKLLYIIKELIFVASLVDPTRLNYRKLNMQVLTVTSLLAFELFVSEAPDDP